MSKFTEMLDALMTLDAALQYGTVGQDLNPEVRTLLRLEARMTASELTYDTAEDALPRAQEILNSAKVLCSK